MTQDAAVEPTFAIGRVLGTSSTVLFRNFVSFGVLALLTKGRRWAILGAWLVFGVVALLCFALLMVVASLVSLGIVLPVLAYIWQALFTAFSAVMTAVSYYYLRVDKEGVAIDEIGAVFD